MLPPRKSLTLLLAAMLTLTACSFLPTPTPDNTTPGPDSGETPVVTAGPTAVSRTTPDATAQAYFDFWQAGDYESLWALLTPESQAQYDAATFAQTYTDTMTNQMYVHDMVFDIDMTRLQSTPTTAILPFTVTYKSLVVGDIVKDDMSLTLQIQPSTNWAVTWSPSMIMPELVGGNILSMDIDAPQRANIYDRNGLWLVQSDSPVATISVIPNLVGDEEEEARMLEDLSSILRTTTRIVLNQYSGIGGDAPIAIGDVDQEVLDDYYRHIYSYEAIVVTTGQKTGRRNYYNLAPQVLGYISFIQEAQAEEYAALGYSPDAIVGQAGLEAAEESILAGTSGGTLTAIAPDGSTYATIAQRESQPAQNVYTTLDRDLQIIVQDTLAQAYFVSQETWSGTANGAAVVVLDVNTGEILAMASYPNFDANIFNPNNANPMMSDNYLALIDQDHRDPYLNHATQAALPPGSIFKIVTTAAALHSGSFDKTEKYMCTGTWREEGLTQRLDWKEEGHGELTLVQGLTASCDPWFYHMGVVLGQASEMIVPEMARAFGLGEPTGIEIREEIGVVPDPDWLMADRGEEWTLDHSVNMAIGQGDLLVTPLQMVNMTAAIANGGTLYRPHLVKMIGPSFDAPTNTVEPETLGTLPLTEDEIAAIQEGMRNVIIDPLIGTAEDRVGGMRITSAGKTGTAQVSSDAQPIAWFAGYAPYEDPEIAIIVVVENGGQGSMIGAPIFRRIVERWYKSSVFHWPDEWLDPELYEPVKGIGE